MDAPLPRRRRRLLLILLPALAIAVVATEVTLRLGWGLGTPLLYDLDPGFEYAQRPNQEIRRFGQRVLVNEHGMRSRSFPARRSDPHELRVLVLGDSVVNGGVLTDHERLATTILERELAAETARPVVVGNISAGSWGPVNLLAFVERFGFFDADIVVILLSSHDAGDVPSDAPPNSLQYPTSPPWSAIGEAWSRYLLPRLKSGESPHPGDLDRLQDVEGVERSLNALRSLIDSAIDSGSSVVLMQYWERSELESGAPRQGHELIAEVARECGIQPVDLDRWFRGADAPDRSRSAGAPLVPSQLSQSQLFRDSIHPSDEGQATLARAIKDAIAPLIAPRATARPDHPPSPSPP